MAGKGINLKLAVSSLDIGRFFGRVRAVWMTNFVLHIGIVSLVGCQQEQVPAASYTLPTYEPASAIPFSDIDNVYIDELDAEPNTFVFAMNKDTSDQGRGAYWGTIDQHGWIRIYEKGPRTSLFQVHYIAISDDDKYLAVATSGEGHPVLDVFELQKWLQFAPRGKDRETPPLDPIASLNPFPFSFSPKGWQDGKFVVASGGPLAEMEQHRRAGERFVLDEGQEPDEPYTFIWDVENDRLKRK